MSENDDRAAKAARAKALLAKKRQQKKAAGDSASNIPSPAIQTRTLSPAPSEFLLQPPAKDDGKRDLADVYAQLKPSRVSPPNSTPPSFGHDAKDDTSWLSSLPRAASPPSRGPSTSPSIPPPTSLAAAGRHFGGGSSPGAFNETQQAEIKRLHGLLEDSSRTESLLLEEKSRADNWNKKYSELEKEKETLLAAERQAISLLVAEKAALKTELEKREDFESKLVAAEMNLGSDRLRLEDLEHRLQTSQMEAVNATQRVHQHQTKEKELVEKSRDLERQLQLATAAAAESRKEVEEVNRRLQELTEQIQTDDRVERLEQSLKHSQDHADELEFQLSKLRQTHVALKSEKDDLLAQCQKYEENEGHSNTRLTDLEGQLKNLQSTCDQVSGQRESLAQEANTLRDQGEANRTMVSDLQQKLVHASSSVSTHTRQMQVLQNELKSAVRRAEESEKTTRNLQLEGTSLMRSLDEMRPKIIELTDAKLHFAEKVENLERNLVDRDATIRKLEASLGELQYQNGNVDTKWQETVSRKDKEHAALQDSIADLQKGYGQLQDELDTALASLKTLETQRTAHHQDTARRLEEIDRLTSSSQKQSEELSSLRHELKAHQDAQEDEQQFLENEIESLRNELDAKDDEIKALQEAVSPLPGEGVEGPHSLGDEIASPLRQQHALDLLNAQSTVRALENTVFESEAKAHALQKQVAGLQDQVSRLQAGSRQFPPRSFSPVPSRPSSRAKDHHDIRRSSFGMHRPNNNTVPQPLSRTIFDQALSPEAMHKRRVSLSMLKARIDSEVSAASTLSRPPSRALSPVHSLSGNEDIDYGHHPVHRPQFLDESHVFWCNSCQGDLVIL